MTICNVDVQPVLDAFKKVCGQDAELEVEVLAALMLDTIFQHTDDSDIIHEHTIPAALGYLNVDVMATAFEMYEAVAEQTSEVTRH